MIQYPAGNLVRYQFDGQDGPVTQGWIRNAGGTTYLNDLSAGNLLSMTRESGAVGDGLSVTTSMEYEPLFNQIASQTDARGNATSYEYDYTRVGYLGNPLRIELPDITQPDGTRVTVHPTEYEYNEAGQTTRSSTGGERVMTWDYNAMGYLVTETFPSGATRFFARDQQGRVLRQSGDFEDIRFDLNGFGEVVRETQDPGGFANVTEYGFDRDGALIETRQELKDNFGSEPGTPPAGSPRRLSTRTDLDLIGRVVRETQRSDDGSLEVEYAYDASGRMVRTAQPGPRGTRTEDLYVYDARGLATEIRMAAGSDQEVVRRSTFDPNGNEIRMEEIAVRSPAGTQPGPPRVTLYEYDGLDRLKATTDPLGARTALTLDADGNPIAEWVAEGQGIHLGETDRVFDELGNLVSEGHHVLDESETVATSQIYLNGFLERVRTVGPGGGVAEYRYDFSGQVDRIVTPGKDTTYTAYDRAGNRTGVRQVEIGERIDSSGITTSVQTSSSVNYEYDALGRVRAGVERKPRRPLFLRQLRESPRYGPGRRHCRLDSLRRSRAKGGPWCRRSGANLRIRDRWLAPEDVRRQVLDRVGAGRARSRGGGNPHRGRPLRHGSGRPWQSAQGDRCQRDYGHLNLQWGRASPHPDHSNHGHGSPQWHPGRRCTEPDRVVLRCVGADDGGEIRRCDHSSGL